MGVIENEAQKIIVEGKPPLYQTLLRKAAGLLGATIPQIFAPLHADTVQRQNDTLSVESEIEPGAFLKRDISQSLDVLTRIATHHNLLETQEYAQAISFINQTYAIYDGSITMSEVFPHLDFSEATSIFAVPARGDDPSELPNGLREFFSTSGFNLEQDNKDFTDLIRTLPPTVLAYYADENSPNKVDGITVFCPADIGWMSELWSKSTKANILTAYGLKNEYKDLKAHVTSAVNEGLAFGKRIAPNAKVAGLGAVLPKLTNLGNSINSQISSELQITTGHRMTILAMYKTFEALILDAEQEKNPIKEVTILGAGYIGEAILRLLRIRYPDIKINIHDIKHELAIKASKEHGGNPIKDFKAAVEGSQLIVSAITTRLTDEQIRMIKPRTKVMDDSEPSIADPRKLLAQRILLIKPLLALLENLKRYGLDPLNPGKKGEYNYGSPSNGAFGVGITNGVEFGCGFEALLAGKFQDANINFTGKVTPESIDALLQIIESLPERVRPQVLIEMLQGGGLTLEQQRQKMQAIG